MSGGKKPFGSLATIVSVARWITSTWSHAPVLVRTTMPTYISISPCCAALQERGYFDLGRFLEPTRRAKRPKGAQSRSWEIDGRQKHGTTS